MFLKSKLIACSVALFLSSSVFALQEGVCPDINQIKAEGMSLAEEMGFNYYLSYTISEYNTGSMWGFFIAPVPGNSAEDAIDTANELLSSMTAPGVVEEQGGLMVCSYETGQPGVIAAAVKSDIPGVMSVMKIKQAFNHKH